MNQEVTLFDLAYQPPMKCWSFNPWKTRLVLNYKSISYKTHWLDFPDIAPHLKSLGVPPNAQSSAYTIPTICLHSSHADSKDEYITDSKAIALALEERHPNPPLHLDAPQLAKAQELWSQVMKALMGVFAPLVMQNLLTDGGREYMAAMANLEGRPVGDEAWEAAKPALEAMGSLLKAKDGPFVLGETVSYADFVLVSGMHFVKRVGDEVFQRWVDMEPACGRLYDASKQWLERDDH